MIYNKTKYEGALDRVATKRAKKNFQSIFSNVMKRLNLPVFPTNLQFASFNLDYSHQNKFLESFTSVGHIFPDPSGAGVKLLFDCWGENFDIRSNDDSSFDFRMKNSYQFLLRNFPFLICGKLVEYYTTTIPAGKSDYLYLVRQGDLSSQNCQQNIYIDTSFPHPM